ncbi:MAG: hypothetical protein EOM31_02645 [Bacteroidia bacterium]|nr:hypothetical protein [Bacteroidia bacterium]
MKSKKSLIVFMALWMGLLQSCIGDTLKGCPYETILYFRFPDLLTPITKVNIGIYDEHGLFVQSIEVQQQNLETSKKIYLSLQPGNYTAVCWGNSLENTLIKGFEYGAHLSDGAVMNPNYKSGGIIQTNDPLYYGKVAFTVVPNITNEVDVHFTAAYDVISVRIEGYEAQKKTTKQPMIRIDHLDPICDFNKVTNDGRDASYYPFIWDSKPDNETYLSAVLPLNTSLVNNIAVNVYADDTANKILCTIDLNTFIRENNINVDDNKETIISILVHFMNGQVAVSLDNWSEVPIEPGV